MAYGQDSSKNTVENNRIISDSLNSFELIFSMNLPVSIQWGLVVSEECKLAVVGRFSFGNSFYR